jgi:quinol monooxygenase YgiN
MPFELHGLIRAKPGRGGVLLAILEDAARNAPGMPGCRSYVVRATPGDEDSLEVDEVWDDEASHHDSLKLESVRATIARARPLIASMASR